MRICHENFPLARRQAASQRDGREHTTEGIACPGSGGVEGKRVRFDNVVSFGFGNRRLNRVGDWGGRGLSRHRRGYGLGNRKRGSGNRSLSLGKFAVELLCQAAESRNHVILSFTLFENFGQGAVDSALDQHINAEHFSKQGITAGQQQFGPVRFLDQLNLVRIQARGQQPLQRHLEFIFV